MEYDYPYLYEKQTTAPKYTNDERVGLSSVTGSMIYNTTINKMQCYDGSNWNDLF